MDMYVFFCLWSDCVYREDVYPNLNLIDIYFVLFFFFGSFIAADHLNLQGERITKSTRPPRRQSKTSARYCHHSGLVALRRQSAANQSTTLTLMPLGQLLIRILNAVLLQPQRRYYALILQRTNPTRNPQRAGRLISNHRENNGCVGTFLRFRQTIL